MVKRATGLILVILSGALIGLALEPAAFAAGPDPSFLTATSAREGLQGTTRDSAGRLLPFVEVRVLSPVAASLNTLSISRVLSEQALTTVRSDAVGRFFISGLMPGAYRVVATKGGYAVVVGQINTLLSASVDLVLHPAGPSGISGTKPEDSSWALRLPERDRLEQESYRVSKTSVRDPQQPSALPVVVDLTHTSVDGNAQSAASGNGVGLGLAASWRLGEGICRAEARYRALSGVDDFEDESHTIGLHWDGSLADGVLLAASLTTDDWQRRPGLLDDGTPFASDRRRDGLQLVGSVARAGARHEWRVDFDRLVVDEPAPKHADEARLARWAAARWSMEQAFGSHTVAVRALGRSAGGAWQADDQGRPSFATVAAIVPIDVGALGAVSGGAVDVAAADSWAAAPALTITSRTRLEYAGGFDRGTRASASTGAAWQAAPWLDLHGEIGMTAGEGSDAIWALQWTGAVDHWSWALSRSHETSVSPWSDQGTYQPANERWITDRAGVVSRWVASVQHVARGRMPALSLRVEQYQVDGRLIARLSGDRAIVPIVDDASGLGRQIELGVSFPGAGTSLIVNWNEIEDRDGPGTLLGGVSAWRQTSVTVRQQLAALSWHGASTQLMLSLEDGSTSDTVDNTQLDAARVALLDQRRLSGGLALSF